MIIESVLSSMRCLTEGMLPRCPSHMLANGVRNASTLVRSAWYISPMETSEYLHGETSISACDGVSIHGRMAVFFSTAERPHLVSTNRVGRLRR